LRYDLGESFDFIEIFLGFVRGVTKRNKLKSREEE
jgi:hypothetical protein